MGDLVSVELKWSTWKNRYYKKCVKEYVEKPSEVSYMLFQRHYNYNYPFP